VTKAVEYSREALTTLQRIDRKTAARIVGKIELLAENPEALANNVKRLKGGAGLMRLRVGDRRVVYRDLVVIAVIRIAPRASAYE
jgi:mRNA interferase RelE/StbE